jgi:raffinose/stachyose/melibiose transport system substrate-binding protein
MFRTKRKTTLVAALTAAAIAAAVSGCSSSSSSSDGNSSNTLTILQFETKGSADYVAFQNAVTLFEQQHPKVKVKLENTSFDAIRQNAKLVLSGNKVPDVVEVNKGNADGGQLAAQGLLTNLTSEVKKEKWNKVVTGSMQNLAKYDSSGNAGSGDWYGVPYTGQDYVLYYNKDAFQKAGISDPTSSSDLTKIFDQFQASGQTPLSSNAGEFGLAQLWYQFVSNTATRKQIDDYMFLKGSTDFSSGPWKAASQELQTWLQKNYLGTQLGSLTQADQEQAFISGKYPMMFDGSWEFSQVKSAAKFDWGTLTFPGAAFNEGLTSQLLSVPTSAKNKGYADEFINDMLSAKVQNQLGKSGGLPLRSDTSVITDSQTKAFTEQFNELKSNDKLSYFPDYPVTGLLEFLESQMQGMANGTKTAAQFDSALQTFYNNGKKQLANG